MTLDGKGTNSNVHAIYFSSNNKLNLTNSTLTIKNYNQDALEWNGFEVFTPKFEKYHEANRLVKFFYKNIHKIKQNTEYTVDFMTFP